MLVSKDLDGSCKKRELNEILNDEMILDIGPKTIEKIIIQIDKEISLINKENNISNVLELIDITNSNIKKSILPDIFLYQRVSGHFIPFTSEGVFIDKRGNMSRQTEHLISTLSNLDVIGYKQINLRNSIC